jgi:hypothetical protein
MVRWSVNIKIDGWLDGEWECRKEESDEGFFLF